MIVPTGQVASIVTFLDMNAPPRPAPLLPSPLKLVRWPRPTNDAYRLLFARVGGPWLWFSRLAMDAAKLAAIIGDDRVEIYAVVDREGIEVGLLELDFRETNTCELAFLGLIPELTGKGQGRWLLAHALALAWRSGISRVHVHTCTLDHPAALRLYCSFGFVARGRAVESFADPRIAGVLPRDCAPRIPLLDAD